MQTTRSWAWGVWVRLPGEEATPAAAPVSASPLPHPAQRPLLFRVFSLSPAGGRVQGRNGGHMGEGERCSARLNQALRMEKGLVINGRHFPVTPGANQSLSNLILLFLRQHLLLPGMASNLQPRGGCPRTCDLPVMGMKPCAITSGRGV